MHSQPRSRPKSMALSIPEPLPGYRSVGEITFLERLPQDFLLRDESNAEDREAGLRRIGIKPKSPHRASLLAVTSFPFLRGSLLIDESSFFPRRIEFQPSPDAILHSLLPGKAAVTIDYTDIGAEPPGRDSFSVTPPEDAHLFTEQFLQTGAASGEAPFPIALEPLEEAGFRPMQGGAWLSQSERRDRGFLIVNSQKSVDGSREAITLRVGNYLSPNMGRRRATLSEKGTEANAGEHAVQLLNRSADWPQGASLGDRQVIEVAWEADGVFGFLLGEGATQEELLAKKDRISSS